MEAKYEKLTQKGDYRRHSVNKNFEANIFDVKIYWRVWATHDGCFLRRWSVDLAYKEFRNL